MGRRLTGSVPGSRRCVWDAGTGGACKITSTETYDMITAVAVGQVGKGDKEDADATAALNAGTVVTSSSSTATR